MPRSYFHSVCAKQTTQCAAELTKTMCDSLRTIINYEAAHSVATAALQKIEAQDRQIVELKNEVTLCLAGVQDMKVMHIQNQQEMQRLIMAVKQNQSQLTIESSQTFPSTVTTTTKTVPQLQLTSFAQPFPVPLPTHGNDQQNQCWQPFPSFLPDFNTELKLTFISHRRLAPRLWPTR